MHWLCQIRRVMPKRKFSILIRLVKNALNLIFNSQFRVLIVRERRDFWFSILRKGLLISSTLTIIGFTLLGIYGIFTLSLTLSQPIIVLGFSALFTLAIDFPKYYLFKRFGL